MRKFIKPVILVLILAVLGGLIYSNLQEIDKRTAVPGQQQAEGEVEGEVEEEVVEEFVLPGAKPQEANSADMLVAENSKYSLYVNEKFGNIRMLEKSSGREWFSSPPVDKSMPPNNKDFIAAPVHVRYTQGVSPSQTYPLKEKAVVVMERIDGGARFTFDFEDMKLAFGFALEYKLTESGFEVTIPDDSIYENGAAKITSLEVLPFFGAEHQDEEGAVFVPDGSGALINFKSVHPDYFSGYSEFIYGGDHAFKNKVNSEVYELFLRKPNVKQYAALPVYGISRNDEGQNKGQGFLGIVTQGDYDAKVNATLPGIRNINMYRASIEFFYRNDDVIFIGNSGEIPLFQANRLLGDRTVRYVLLTGDKADYVGMAGAYRDYLTDVQGLKPVAVQKTPLQLRFFGGLLREELIGTTYVDMTTFEQARKIIDAFIGKGITQLEITIDGWSDDGLYGNQPSHFPVEKKLGGKKELQTLAEYAKSKGIDLYLIANYVRPYSESSVLKPSRDAIRGLDKEVRRMPNYFISTRFTNRSELFYMLKPGRVYDKYIKKEVGKFADLGIAGVHLQYMGDTLYSDHDRKGAVDRSQTAAIWRQTLSDFRDKVGKASVDYGFAYTFGLVDRIDNVPVDSSHFTFQDRAVPFYQIALHGLVPYTMSPSNLADDPRIPLLKALEYGALPSYELTWQHSENLARTMTERLFSGQYDQWLDKAIEEYGKVAEVLDHVKDQAIVGHEQLYKEVFRTTYEDGTSVVVNYGDTTELVGNVSVSGYSYVIEYGGGGR